jgi:CubicO group peptidase (beta-lactamase class C family)
MRPYSNFRVSAAVLGGVLAVALGCSDSQLEGSEGVTQSALLLSIQAESGTWSNAVVENNHAGATGTGFVNTANVSNTWVQWNVSAPAAGLAGLTIRFANASGNRPARIEVNGAVAVSNLSFPVTGAWSNWSTLATTLNVVPGSNTIRVVCTGSTGCPNFDRIDLDLPNGGGTGGTGGAGGGAQAGSSGSGGTAGSSGSGGLGGAIQQDIEFFDRPSAFILQPGQVSSPPWRYRFTVPPADWKEEGFNDSTWSSGAPGFHSGPAMHHDVLRTPWAARRANGTLPDLYARSTFVMSSDQDVNEAMFWGRWDDTLEVYINGVLAVSENEWAGGYRYTGINPEARRAIKVSPGPNGEVLSNTLAVKVKDHPLQGEAYFDLGITRNARFRQMPIDGFERSPRLAEYTWAMQRFMQEHGLTAATLAVMKDNRVVLNRSFGWKDRNLTTPLPANALMRLASVQKSSTVAAMRKIITEGYVDPVSGQTITGSTLVFPLLVQHGLTPPPGATVDPRINTITIQHLMDHKAGLPDVDTSSFYTDLQISIGQERPIDNVRWLYGRPLLFTPPSADAVYSNAGYGVLQFLITLFKGDLATYLRTQLFAQVAPAEFFPAYERLNLRSSREPWSATVEHGAPRWLNTENENSVVATAEALVRSARAYDLFNGAPLLDPTTGAYTGGGGGVWVRGGGGAGVSSVLYQNMGRELSFAVIFNISTDIGVVVHDLELIMTNMPESAYN